MMTKNCFDYNGDKDFGCEDCLNKSKGDLISREALKKHIIDLFEEEEKHDKKWAMGLKYSLKIIDNASTNEINTNDIQYAYDQGFKSGYELGKEERPHGEREFIEILAQNVPEDLCTYPEYKGKPYYSIHYKENGEDFVGFGTYNPEVLSRYLRDYFITPTIIEADR